MISRVKGGSGVKGERGRRLVKVPPNHFGEIDGTEEPSESVISVIQVIGDETTGVRGIGRKWSEVGKKVGKEMNQGKRGQNGDIGATTTG